MGVDFYTCDECGYNFPDCGDYFRCDCGAKFCSNKCGGKEYIDDAHEETSCIMCRKESVTTSDLLKFILRKYNLTWNQAFELYKAEKDEDE